MRYIITGGSGFTGSYMCRALLQRGVRPVVFDQTPPAEEFSGKVDFVQGDIRSAESLGKIGFTTGDAVFHLAARQFHLNVPHSNRDAWFAEINIGGTRAVVDAMRAGGATDLVFFSTDMTYGRPQHTPVPNTHPQNPIGPYGRSKKQAEAILKAAVAEHGFRCTIFRPRLISGAGRLGILVKLFTLVRKGLPVPMIGAGNNRYQMIAVEDCVAAALRAADCGFPAGPFNLGSDNPPTVRELLQELIDKTDSHSLLIPTPARAVQCVLSGLDKAGLTLLYPEQFAIADADYILDTSETRKQLDWTPTRRDADIIFDAYQQCWLDAGH